MKGIRDFIIQVENQNESAITTEKGVKIHVDKRWNMKEAVNSVAKVIEVPCGYDGPIKVGYNVFVDPTIFAAQNYVKGGQQASPNLLDSARGLYKVQDSMIVCYSEGEGTLWKGNRDNVLVERIAKPKQEEKRIGSIIIPESPNKTNSFNTYRLFIMNEDFSEHPFGTEVIINEGLMIDIYLRGVKLVWVRTKDILGLVTKDAA